MFTEVISPSQQEFTFWNDILSHLHPKSMFRLAKLVVIPSIFLDFKYDVPLCSLFMFRTGRNRQYKIKGKKLVSIRKETDNNPGSGFSVDQLQSDELVLVPQLSGKLTGAKIWSAQVMVDHFSHLVYVDLLISTSQEETLPRKAAFEI